MKHLIHCNLLSTYVYYSMHIKDEQLSGHIVWIVSVVVHL
jgi:hypothetical protein